MLRKELWLTGARLNIKSSLHDLNGMPIYFEKKTIGNQLELIHFMNNNTSYFAYYLHFKSEWRYSLDLPAHNPAATLFLTAPLTGCCVGIRIRKNRRYIRVYHWNRDEMSLIDKIRGHDATSWLLPHYYRNVMNNDKFDGNFSYYPFKKVDEPSSLIDYKKIKKANMAKENFTCFWGEYFDMKWHFYYQTPDLKIHFFDY